jgi:CO dehydrogenase maturation factor
VTTTIAISGKGGSGKTTVAAMIIRSLIEQSSTAGAGAILAVDADPNSCLGLTLGVESVGTIAEIREDARAQAPTTTGMDKLRSLEYGLQQSLTEAKGFDLLTMGRPEGPDCYCAVNNMLRKFLDKMSEEYRFVVVDNEAGMEHLSRRTTNNVDLLCIVSEPTPIGVVTTRRIFQLTGKLPISVKEVGVVWNRVATECADEPQVDGLSVFGRIPMDTSILESSIHGKTVFDLAADSPALVAVRKIVEDRVILKSVKSEP